MALELTYASYMQTRVKMDNQTRRVEPTPPQRPVDLPPETPWPPDLREYPKDHIALTDLMPDSPFNEDWAREDFGNFWIDSAKKYQSGFRGDWWWLCYLLICISDAKNTDPDGQNPKRFEWWNKQAPVAHMPFRVCLNYAKFNWNHLEYINLIDIDLEHASFRHAHLKNALLRGANLSNANLDVSRLEYAKLNMANLSHTTLHRAILDHADVRFSEGLLFNENDADRLRIEGDAKDPWSILRRKYTGPKYIFNLLLLIAFLLPFTARVLHLTGIADIQESLLATAEHTSTVANDSIQILGQQIQPGIENYQDSHKQVPAIWVLLGGSKGWLFIALTSTVIFYNALRLLLTSRVSSLRDAEERSRITPSLSDYYGRFHPLSNEKPNWKNWSKPILRLGLYRIHLIAQVLFWIAAIAFLFNISHWLLTTWVWIPN